MRKILSLTTILFSFLIFVGSINSSEAQLDINPIDNPLKEAIGSKTPLIQVEYHSDKLVVLRGDEDILLAVNGTMNSFWNAIEITKQFGYSLDQVTTSGMGSQGNPTRFYAIMTKP